ncbi:hypothetical protein CHLRE_21g752447v5 [Chlamydomonas reinhardtii]|nr:uncharacterized protein CHLRE_21g752447v5 [Chlamydomonas reinhardtii]PNW69757.1 hypothetical protein CHLRE_21g752447v5 [Chlamydomonas reinhardtii]
MLSSFRSAKAAGTWRVYDARWLQFSKWCAGQGFDPYDCAPATAASYLQELTESARQHGVGPQTIEQASAAVTAHFSLVGRPSPMQHPLAALLREAARRTLVPRRRQRELLTFDELETFVAFHLLDPAAPPSLEVRMLVTGCVLAFTGLLRFDDLSRVMVHHELLRVEPGAALEIHLWRSKTDQRADGADVTIGATGGLSCPVALVEQLFAAGAYNRFPGEGEDAGPLMRAVTPGTDGAQRLQQVTAPLASPIPALPYSYVYPRVTELLRAAGITKKVGTHSFRASGATAAVEGGADRTLVRKTGRWAEHSKVFEKRYVKESAATMAAVTRAMTFRR